MGNKIILDGVVVDNTVIHVDDEQALPEGDITVSLPRWQQQRDELLERGRCGVRLAGSDDVGQLAADVSALPLIAIEFPAFTDGRGYTHARLLRDRHGFRGQLRAVGDIGQDQLFPLQRCGFNAFELNADVDAEAALDGLDDFTVNYQPAADVALPLFRSAQR